MYTFKLPSFNWMKKPLKKNATNKIKETVIYIMITLIVVNKVLFSLFKNSKSKSSNAKLLKPVLTIVNKNGMITALKIISKLSIKKLIKKPHFANDSQ